MQPVLYVDLMRFALPRHKVQFIIGHTCAVISGIVLPSFAYIIGSIFDEFALQNKTGVTTYCVAMSCLGLIVLVLSFF
jgi:ribosomal protein S26